MKKNLPLTDSPSIADCFAPFRHGIAFLRRAAGKTTQQLITEGTPEAEAKHITKLYEIYFGRTKFTRRQSLARKSPHSYEVLKTIENYTPGLSNAQRWALREHLAQRTGPLGVLRALARKFVKAFKAPAAPKPGITRTIHKNTGMRSLKLTGTNAQMADLETLIPREKTASGERRLRGFIDNAKQGGAGFAVQTVATIHLDDLLAVVRGGRPDITVPCSNGANLDIDEYLARYCADRQVVAVFNDAGPLKLERMARLGNYAQRLVAKAETQTCAFKDCSVPADDCELHHIHDYHRGGPTNSENLTFLCRHHNGSNGKARRGRVRRVGGQIAWQSPYSGRVTFTGRKVSARV